MIPMVRPVPRLVAQDSMDLEALMAVKVGMDFCIINVFDVRWFYRCQFLLGIKKSNCLVLISWPSVFFNPRCWYFETLNMIPIIVIKLSAFNYSAFGYLQKVDDTRNLWCQKVWMLSWFWVTFAEYLSIMHVFSFIIKYPLVLHTFYYPSSGALHLLVSRYVGQ